MSGKPLSKSEQFYEVGPISGTEAHEGPVLLHVLSGIGHRCCRILKKLAERLGLGAANYRDTRVGLRTPPAQRLPEP